MGNEESHSASGEEAEDQHQDHHGPQLQKTNSQKRSRSSIKNSVYAEIYDSAVSTVNEAATTIAQFEPVSQGLDILSDAANAVSDIAGQGIEVVTTAFDDLLQDAVEDEEGEDRHLRARDQQQKRGTQQQVEGREGEDGGGVGDETLHSHPRGGEEEGAPPQRHGSQNHLKSRATYKNSVYNSIYESASETFNEAVTAVTQFATEGIETVSHTIDELMEDAPPQEGEEARKEEKEVEAENTGETGEDVFQYVSDLISTGVSEVANQIDYDSISHTILKAVQDINEVLGVEPNSSSSEEQDYSSKPATTTLDPSQQQEEEDLMELPENPYATASIASLEGAVDSQVIESAPPQISREEEQTID